MRDRPGWAYLFLSPWVLGVLLLTLGPMAASLYLSFTDYDLFSTPNWVGFSNYADLFSDDERFLTSVWVTVKYVLLSTPLKLIAALAVAVLLNRASRAQGFYRSAFYAPSLLGASVAVALSWRVIFNSWVSNPSLSLLTLVALAVWQFGAPMVIFLAGLKQVPQELYDASSVDGAGAWRTFRSVTLPMLSPVIFFNLVLETIHAFQAFTGAFVISGGRGGPVDSTLFYSIYLYQKGFNEFRMGYASAMAWVLVLVVALITAVLFRTARTWVFYVGDDR